MANLTDFVLAPKHLLEADTKLCVDLYIFLNLNDTVIHFRRQGDVLSAADLETLKKVPDRYVLIPKGQLKFLMEHTADGITERMQRPDQVKSPAVQSAAKEMLSTLSAAQPKGDGEGEQNFVSQLLNEAASVVEKMLKNAPKTLSVETYETVLKQWKHQESPLISHFRQVSAMAVLIQLELGDAAYQDVTDLGLASLMHDLGLLQMPNAITDRHLKGEDEFNPSEKIIYMRHIDATIDVIKAQKFDLTPGVARIITHHHENWDGSGFKGLKLGQIYRPARVLRIADVLVSTLNHPGCRLDLLAVLRGMAQKNGSSGDPLYDPAILLKLLGDLQVNEKL